MPTIANNRHDGAFAGRLQRGVLRVGEFDREYVLHAPASHDPSRPAPLVIAFHGAGGSARFARLATGWSEKAEHEGFLLVYPEGLRKRLDQPSSFLHNPQFWNVGADGFIERMGVDDVAFIDTLLDGLSREFAIDSQRVFATGFSNGASLCFRLAAALSHRFAAIAPVAGRLWRHDLRPAKPVPTLYITGDADPLNPIAGGAIESPWGRERVLPPLSETIETWASWSGCNIENPKITTMAEGVTRTRYRGMAPRSLVDCCVIAGAGHVWPGGREVLAERLVGAMTDRIDATRVIWDFFCGAALLGASSQLGEGD